MNRNDDINNNDIDNCTVDNNAEYDNKRIYFRIHSTGMIARNLLLVFLTFSLTACGGNDEASGLDEFDGQITNALQNSSYNLEIEDSTSFDIKPDENGIVHLGFAGDLCLAEGAVTTEKMDASENGIRDCFSEDLLERMKSYDIFMLNNEFSYSTRGTKSEKTYTFRADPSRVDNLKELGVDLVLTANNHINDYGPEAVLDTLDTLDNAGIPYVGAGRNSEEARKIIYYNVGDYKIAYVAASRAEEYESTIWTATASDSTPGVLGCYDGYDCDLFLSTISEAAANSDYVIACVHWGYEYVDYYAPEHQELANKIIGAGADAIIGGHPHVLQGIQLIDNKPVFYSLGNFWFNDQDLYSGLAELDLKIPSEPGGTVELAEARFVPCTQYGVYTALSTDSQEKQKIIDHVANVSTGVHLDENGVVSPW